MAEVVVAVVQLPGSWASCTTYMDLGDDLVVNVRMTWYQWIDSNGLTAAMRETLIAELGADADAWNIGP